MTRFCRFAFEDLIPDMQDDTPITVADIDSILAELDARKSHGTRYDQEDLYHVEGNLVQLREYCLAQDRKLDAMHRVLPKKLRGKPIPQDLVSRIQAGAQDPLTRLASAWYEAQEERAIMLAVAFSTRMFIRDGHMVIGGPDVRWYRRRYKMLLRWVRYVIAKVRRADPYAREHAPGAV